VASSTSPQIARSRHRVTQPKALARWTRLALALVGATLAYNTIEAVIGIAAGAAAGSIALVGFGLDSVIEIAAAAALLWRLRVEALGADRVVVERAERRVHRLVGGTFLALVLYILVEAGWTLWTRDAPLPSTVGMILAAASLLLMPAIAWGKLRAADRIGSPALRAEAKETLACSYLSLTLLLGLIANAAAGWWWADPIAAMLMVPWLIREGIEGLSGEACSEECRGDSS